jgi:uncharacterized membrane protein YoaK (UPF0700 family)
MVNADAAPGTAKYESISTGAMMAGAGGFLDAFTYVGHGHVFANAMTGNVVLFGVSLAARHYDQALRHFVPICAFVAGIVFARLLHLPRIAYALVSPHVACMVIEVVFLFAVGWLPAAFPDTLLTLGVAFVASIQLSTFSHVRGAAYASTFTTGNLRKLTESAFAFAVNRADMRARILVEAFAVVCIAFTLGAWLGSVLTANFGNRAAWFVDAWIAVLTVRFIRGMNRSA